MSPLDDELRAVMHARADVLSPSPDPLAGIESRARGLRRRRVAASVAGAAMALAAIAVAVPTLGLPSSSPQGDQFAAGPVTPGPAALDPKQPWTFRGTAPDTGTADTYQREWGVKHPGSTLTLLFAEINEFSGAQEAFFVATGGSDGDRYGYVRSSESGPEFDVDEPYSSPQAALQFALPGDEGVSRLFVVASPESKSVERAADGSDFRPMTTLAAGIGITPLEGDTSKDEVRVIGSNGKVVYEQEGRDREAAQPSNVLASWPQRGSAGIGFPEDNLLARFAQASGRPGEESKATYRSLFSGSNDGGVRYTFGQAWFEGELAHNVGFITGGTNGTEFFYGRVTPQDPAVLAFVVSSSPGSSVDELVVIPQPGTGQVLYSPQSTGAFKPVTGQGHLDGVVIIDRSTTPGGDRLQLLDGDGDLNNPTYEGPVLPLLCGNKGCG